MVWTCKQTLEKMAKQLKLEDMEDLLDLAESFGEIMEAMNKALEIAFMKTEKEKN